MCRDFHHLGKPRPGLLQQLIDVLHPREPLNPRTWCPQVSHCRMAHPCPVGCRAYRGMLLSPMPNQTQIFQGHFLLSMAFTSLWRKSSAWSQLKSMQWQPRLISHPHAIFFNYVIRKILLTDVLNPLETQKFHFLCIYSSSLTTCWFFLFFSSVGRNSKSMQLPFIALWYQPELRFLWSVCASVKDYKCIYQSEVGWLFLLYQHSQSNWVDCFLWGF